MNPHSGGRIQAIDAIRGLCVVLMCAHHFLYDLAAFLGAPWWIFTNPVLDVLHWFFAGCFILLSGVSSRFSRSNLHTADDMDDASEILQEISDAGDTVLFESRIPDYEEEE